MGANNQDWVDLKHDRQTGLESVRAHFGGHAFDLHWHDSYLVGFTEQGVQRFHCRAQKQICLPGTSFMLEPGEVHDGDAPADEGFTYRMLFLESTWLKQHLAEQFEDIPDNFELSVASTLSQDKRLAAAVAAAFSALHHDEPEIVRDACLDQMLAQLTAHSSWRKPEPYSHKHAALANAARDYLHAHIRQNIGLADMAESQGVSRYRISREFKHAYGIAPHAYLIQLRLAVARTMLAKGLSPADVSSALCFSDQSHMGRWFKRRYQLRPAEYQRCTNLPDWSLCLDDDLT